MFFIFLDLIHNLFYALPPMPDVSYIVVEDELKSRETLLQKIDMCHLVGLVCLGLAANADEALWLVEKNQPDIIITDINLPGKNGFECLELIKKVDYDPEIIFTSAYSENEYLLKALKKGPVNYLIKPIDIDELAASFEKAISRVHLKQNQVSGSGKLKFTGLKEILYLKPEQIAFCKADGHFTNLYLTLGKTEVICQSIGTLEKLLPRNMFFRTDRSTLLNISIVESVDLKKQNCRLHIDDYTQTVEISSIGLKRLMDRME